MSFDQLLISTLGNDLEEEMSRIESSNDLETDLYDQVVALNEAEKDAHDGVTSSAEDTSDHEKETDDATTASAVENAGPSTNMETGSENETAAPDINDQTIDDAETDPKTAAPDIELDDQTMNDGETGPKTPKKKSTEADVQLRLNRNAKKQFNNLKNKIENLQSNFHVEPNFILIMENNFVKKVGQTGPTPATSDKVLVVGKGNLMDLFKSDELMFDLESMEVIKTGVKGMVPDGQFLKDFIKAKRSSVPLQPAASGHSPAAWQSAAAGHSATQLQQLQLQMHQQTQQQLQLQLQQQQLQMFQYPSPMFPTPSASPSMVGSPPVVAGVSRTSRNTTAISLEPSVTVSSKKPKKKNPPKKRLSEIFESDSEESCRVEDLVDDNTDYSEEDQDFIKRIEKKNLQRKRKTVSSDSEDDLTESDHGCEVMGAGADKTRKKRKVGRKAAENRKVQKKSNDILPVNVTKKPAAAKKTVKKTVVTKSKAAQKTKKVPKKSTAANVIENIQAKDVEATLPRKIPVKPSATRLTRRAKSITESSINKLLFPSAGRNPTSSKRSSMSSNSSDPDLLRTPKRILT